MVKFNITAFFEVLQSVHSDRTGTCNLLYPIIIYYIIIILYVIYINPFISVMYTSTKQITTSLRLSDITSQYFAVATLEF